MKRLFAGLLLVVAFAAMGCSSMGASASLRVRSAPPPPSMSFSADPQFSYLADRHVGVIADDSFGYDLFSSGGSYYLYNGGYWYNSDSARGQYKAVDTKRVPKDIFDVKDSQYRWRSHPEGWRGQADGSSPAMHDDKGGNSH